MRNLLFALTAFLATAVLTGCPSPSNPPIPNGKFNATIDGHNWTATNISSNDYTSANGRTFSIYARNVSDKQLSITFFNLKQAGAYPIIQNATGSDTVSCAAVSYYVTYLADQVASGQIIVTNVNGTSVAGTFAFTTLAGVNITDGIFNITR